MDAKALVEPHQDGLLDEQLDDLFHPRKRLAERGGEVGGGGAGPAGALECLTDAVAQLLVGFESRALQPPGAKTVPWYSILLALTRDAAASSTNVRGSTHEGKQLCSCQPRTLRVRGVERSHSREHLAAAASTTAL